MKFSLCQRSRNFKPDAVFEVRECLLPILYWEDIPVIEETRRSLNAIERFILEASLELGDFSAAELAEISGVAVRVVYLTLHRLTELHLLESNDPCTPNSFRPVVEQVQTALEEQAVIVEQKSRRSFVFLPDTSDLITLRDSESGTWRSLNRESPACSYPLPKEMSDEDITDIIGRILENHGESLRVDHTANRKIAHPQKLCPAYRCFMRCLTVENSLRLHVWLENHPQRLDLSACNRLITVLKKQACKISDNSKGFAEAIFGESINKAPSLERQAASLYRMPLTESMAELRSSTHNLADPISIAIDTERGAVFEVEVSLHPADDQSRIWFARDNMAQNVIRTPSLADSLDSGERESVLDRIWQLGSYRTIYKIRGPIDFPYD